VSVPHTGPVEAPTAALADAAAAALVPVLGPVVVVPGQRFPSSDRSVVLRAVARDRAGRDHPVVLKAPVGSGLGSTREEAALRLVADAQVPGVVRLLAASTDPALLVLADVSDGPTLADRLLADDPAAAEAAVLDWAARLGACRRRPLELGRSSLPAWPGCPRSKLLRSTPHVTPSPRPARC